MEGVGERAPRLGYRPGLDGLRAIAVAGVFLYHARVNWLPGGFLGVDLFFVLSGYLITSLLLVEWDAKHVIDLRRFWARRARRLFPAVVVVVLASLILAAIFARDDLSRTRGDAVSSLLYYTNWHEIIASHSYFAQVGRPSLLQHLWSLAVEEQFYVLWPLLLVPGLVMLGRKRFAILVVAGIAASTAEMWLLYNPDDPSRVYYGTDTRAALLLMGILLAIAWPLFERLRGRFVLGLELFGVAALAATVLLFRQLNDFGPTLYRGGDLAAAFCFAVLIAAAAHPASRLGPVVGWGPLRWVGERSYGIYLWHFPILMLLRPGVDVRWTGPGLVVVQAALIVLTAELSFRFVEQPIRTGRLQRRLAERPRRRLVALGVTAALAAAFGALFATPSASSGIPSVLTASTSTPVVFHPGRLPHQLVPTVEKPKAQPLPPRVLAIGDSVMLGCSSALRTELHGRVLVDAVVGRQVEQAVSRIEHYRHSKAGLPPAVVVQVGDNGPTWYQDLVRLRRVLRGVQRVVLVNVRVDRSWENQVDLQLGSFARVWPQARIADWYGHSKDNELSDGVHPWPYACTTYAQVIATALQQPS
jgi:peptidoglycan/LPS O-acetylase OafA/YrhL